MTFCNTKTVESTRCKDRKIHLNFDGGVITSDAGSILLNQIHQFWGLFFLWTARHPGHGIDACHTFNNNVKAIRAKWPPCPGFFL